MLEGRLHLQFELHLMADAWGQSYPLRLSEGVYGIVWTPATTEGGRSIAEYDTPSFTPIGAVLRSTPRHTSDFEWGFIWPNDKYPGSGISHVLGVNVEAEPPTTEHPDSPPGPNTVDLLDAWLKRFRRWCAAEAGYYTGLGEGIRDSHETGRDVQAWWKVDDLDRGQRGSIRLTVLKPSVILDASDLGTLVEQTNSGDDPPIALDQLAQARNAFIEGDDQTTVIRAATAAEIVLYAYVERRLAVLGKMGEEILRRPPSLGTLAAWVQSDLILTRTVNGAAETFTPNLNKDLVSVRNRVAHRGETPSHLETRTALDLAQALVLGLSEHKPMYKPEMG
jgi:hypothetical protein